MMLPRHYLTCHAIYSEGDENVTPKTFRHFFDRQQGNEPFMHNRLWTKGGVQRDSRVTQLRNMGSGLARTLVRLSRVLDEVESGGEKYGNILCVHVSKGVL